MALIKRYSNRKLYNLDEKRYVTLDEISDIILLGESIRVIDHLTGDDLTTQILSQIIQTQEKNKRGQFSQLVLEKIIRSSISQDTEQISKLNISSTINRIVEIEIGNRVKNLATNGQISTAQEVILHQELLSDLSNKLNEHWEQEQAVLLTSAELEQCLSNCGLPSQDDLALLNEQIQELFEKVDNLSLLASQV